jgi:hypothetical protein
MKISSIPKPGRKDLVIYSETRHGNVARQYTPPRNPRAAQQQAHRRNVRAVSDRWRTLTPEKQAAWCDAVANKYYVTKTGRRRRCSGYQFFRSLNIRRADLGLPQYDLPKPEPAFGPIPVSELAVTNVGGRTTVKLRLSGVPVQEILVYGAAPVRTGVRRVQHCPFLGLLPASIDGWSDITELYVARFGEPKPGTAIWIRVCQHIDGWNSAPIEFRVRVEGPTT